MFTIIGGDGHEYGPASAEQLRSWIAAGRANLETKAKAVGSDEWRPLGDYPEFSGRSDTPPLIDADATAAEDPTVAERWRRFVGALADGVLESFCWTPSSIVMMRAISEMAGANHFDPQEIAHIYWSALPLSLPYLGALMVLQAVLLTIRGQSIGNILLHTRIVRATDGGPAGFLRAFLLRGFLARALRQVPLLGGLFWIVDCCFIFRDDKRCLHDLIANTKVVKV